MNNIFRSKMYWRSLFETPNTKLFKSVKRNLYQLLDILPEENYDKIVKDYEEICSDLRQLEFDFSNHQEYFKTENPTDNDKLIMDYLFDRMIACVFDISEFISRPTIYKLIISNIF